MAKKFEELVQKFQYRSRTFCDIRNHGQSNHSYGFYRERTEVILGREAHIYNLEVGAFSCLSQVQPRIVSVCKGYYDPVEIEDAIQESGIKSGVTGVV